MKNLWPNVQQIEASKNGSTVEGPCFLCHILMDKKPWPITPNNLAITTTIQEDEFCIKSPEQSQRNKPREVPYTLYKFI
jgi:hypothetical protein